MCYGVNCTKISPWNNRRPPNLVTWICAFAVLVFFIYIPMPATADTEIMYEFLDNITLGAHIGNIKRDSKFHKRYSNAELDQFTFTYLPKTINHRHQAYFRLRGDTGGLYAKQFIDRDNICAGKPICFLHLDIAVQPAQYFQVIRVLINIHDANDNTPTFPQNEMDFSVSEAVPLGVLLYLPPAIDPDIGIFSVDRYELLGGEGLFGIDVTTTGDVRILLLNNLNRETNDVHTLTVSAYDGGNPPKSGNMTLNIYVDDVNDNAPKFIDPTMDINVSEDMQRGSTLLHVHAIDLDEGKNGKLSYVLSNNTLSQYGSMFRLNAKTGKLTLAKSLDREKVSQYVLDIIAKDSGEFSIPAEAKLFINVLDVNDNAPEITVDPLVDNEEIVVMESLQERAFIAHLSVKDDDLEENGRLNCSIDRDGADYFELIRLYNEEYKIVAKHILDREIQDRYDISIECHDLGMPRLSASVELPIIVADINDHVPKFNQDIYTCAVFENERVDGALVTVKAREPDAGQNGNIEYSLGREAGNVFQINKINGEITTTTTFNREEIGNMVQFYVFATDQGFIPQTASATVQVKIFDVNDEPPRFTQSKYIFNLFENLPGNSIIGVVSAFDNDLPPHTNFSFYLDASKTNISQFRIDPKTGVLRSKVAFDREKQAVHDVFIRVQGDITSKHQDDAMVQVYINDINDNVPNITYPNINKNKVYVASSSKPGHVFSGIEAFDPDEGVNGMLTYQFTNDTGDLFAIDGDTGTISVSGDISHYVHELFLHKVIVTDKGFPALSSKCVFYIIVTNKLSQKNAWDISMAEGRPMSMELRVSIIFFVVIMSMVCIIVFSVATRIYYLNKKSEIFYGDVDTFSDTNGVLPNSYARSVASSIEYSSAPNDEVFYVKSRKRSKSSVSMSTSASNCIKDSLSDDAAKEIMSDIQSDDLNNELTSDMEVEKQRLMEMSSDTPQSPSSVVSNYRRKSVHFEEDMGENNEPMSATSPSPPSTWDTNDIDADRLKHAIPGVCTIIAGSSSDNLQKLAQPNRSNGHMKAHPNENIVRYSQSVAPENEYLMQCSPPPIPKHEPLPICISSSIPLQQARYANGNHVRHKIEKPRSLPNGRIQLPRHLHRQGVNSQRYSSNISKQHKMLPRMPNQNGSPRIKVKRKLPRIDDEQQDDSDGIYI